MSDLMQRVVQKLEQADADHDRVRDGVADGITALTILLAESELVAGLAPEVKREVLAALLGEALADHDWGNFNHFRATLVDALDECIKADDYSNEPVTKAFVAFLAPLEAPCPDCGGNGFTVETRPVCCNRPLGYECCGDPEPMEEQVGCERCQTTGKVIA